MESVRKALWSIESRFGGEVSLDELSAVAGISRLSWTPDLGPLAKV